jgi:hypothetical protein
MSSQQTKSTKKRTKNQPTPPHKGKRDNVWTGTDGKQRPKTAKNRKPMNLIRDPYKPKISVQRVNGRRQYVLGDKDEIVQ